jgi:hypothetical protein
MQACNDLCDVQRNMFGLSPAEVKGRINSTIKDMHEYIACPRCNKTTDRLNETVFVSKCAHIYCKPCFAAEGHVCGVCSESRHR